jgi:nitrogen regulatory protein PII
VSALTGVKNMRMVTAIIEPFKLEEIHQALDDAADCP